MLLAVAVALPLNWAALRGAPWTPQDPATNPLANASLAEVQSLLGTNIVPAAGVPKGRLSAVDLPAAFDSRAHPATQACIHPIRNQQHCGSCWAFGASEVLSDNLCVLTHGQTDVVLSPQDLVSCDPDDSGCSGGALPFVWMYIQQAGIDSDSCSPYTAGNGTSGACSASCADGTAKQTYKCPSGHEPSVWETTAEMQQAIMTYGSVETAFTVFADFMHYGAGVYKHVTGKELGGHAIKVVGWGHDDEDQLYWLVANSWGPSWGLAGYFQIYDWTVDADSAFAKQGGYSCGVTDSVMLV